MPEMLKSWGARAPIGAAVLGSALLYGMAPSTSSSASVLVSNSDVTVVLRAGEHAPRIDSMSSPRGNTWSNSTEVRLPATVEMGGATIPISWQLKPQLGSTGGHRRRVVFVYESTNPHLRLLWQWETRADFGPVEHRIAIENLSGQDVWLPIVDSIRLEWRMAPAQMLNNLYIEKGADTPSAEGMHLELVNEGYSWMGKSSTYAHPVPGEKREIIPAEIIYAADSTQSGWYAGIEFSGRTRISLERDNGSLRSVLGLDPEPGAVPDEAGAGREL